MLDDRAFSRSFQIKLAGNRRGGLKLILERNGTSSGAELPFCLKCRSANFMRALLEEMDYDGDRLQKGSYNWYIFLTQEEAGELFTELITHIPQFGSKPDDDDDGDDDAGLGTVLPLGGTLLEDDDLSDDGDPEEDLAVPSC